MNLTLFYYYNIPPNSCIIIGTYTTIQYTYKVHLTYMHLNSFSYQKRYWS